MTWQAANPLAGMVLGLQKTWLLFWEFLETVKIPVKVG